MRSVLHCTFAVWIVSVEVEGESRGIWCAEAVFGFGKAMDYGNVHGNGGRHFEGNLIKWSEQEKLR